MADQYLWTPADGSPAIDLTDEAAGYSVEADGTRGLRSVAYRFTTSQYAGIDGDTVDAITAEANRPSLGMLIQARSESELRARSRRLVHDMRPQAGPGTLTVATEEGERRSLTCYVEGGLEGDESDDTMMPGRWWRFLLKLYAPVPWWHGDARTMSLGLGAATNFFPIFPLVLSPSTVQGAFTVDLSDTDAPAYPVWTITGPGSSLVLTNQTTGKVIQVNASIGAGEIVVINTQPGQQSVRRGDGTNLLPSVTSDPALWPLIVGVNQITAALAGATAQSRITAAYMPRYAGT